MSDAAARSRFGRTPAQKNDGEDCEDEEVTRHLSGGERPVKSVLVTEKRDTRFLLLLIHGPLLLPKNVSRCVGRLIENYPPLLLSISIGRIRYHISLDLTSPRTIKNTSSWKR